MFLRAIGLGLLALSGCTAQLGTGTNALITDVNTLEMVCPAIIGNQATAIYNLKNKLDNPAALP